MLKLSDVVEFLIESGLLTADSVVDGELRILDVSGRNRVYLVQTRGATGLVVKVAGDGSRMRLESEARTLEWLGSAGMAAQVSCIRTYDAARGILVLEARPRARPLSAVWAAGPSPSAPARDAARALALLHTRPATWLDDAGIGSRAPWMLRLHEPDWTFVREASQVQLELLERVQRSATLLGGLNALRADWRPTALIHGDARWSNFLVHEHNGVELLDWETVMLGDPALDLGAFMSEYLAQWLYSTPTIGATPVVRLSRIPLDQAQSSIRVFWEAYAGECAAEGPALGPRLRRATRFAAARLIETAIERAEQQAETDGFERQLLDLGGALFAEPDRATVQLLGIRARWRSG